jgi:hypothetical protein
MERGIPERSQDEAEIGQNALSQISEAVGSRVGSRLKKWTIARISANNGGKCAFCKRWASVVESSRRFQFGSDSGGSQGIPRATIVAIGLAVPLGVWIPAHVHFIEHTHGLWLPNGKV